MAVRMWLPRPRFGHSCRGFCSSVSDMHWFEWSQGHRLRHNPFNSIIAPRPIGWIGSKSASGFVNLAPYSFFNCINYHPPLIGFASIGWKDTVRNVSETGEFTWNLATYANREAVNASCEPVDHEVNEFELAGMTEAPSKLVAPPRVKESPVNFECKLTQLVQMKDAKGGDVDTYMVFGEVIGVHIHKSLIKDGAYDTLAADPIFRGGGPADFFRISKDNHFEVHRKFGHLEDPQKE